jgi:hypothetical protein
MIGGGILASGATALLAALALAACGSSEPGAGAKKTTTAASAKKAVAHKITVAYEKPADADQAQAQQLLSLGGLDGVAAGFSKSFRLPVDLRIEVLSAPGSPHYDPATKTVTLYYPFVETTATILRNGQPGITDNEFGKQLAAVDAFIFIHELGHAFVDVFDIPITGREEDAVDGMATVFLTDNVDNGLEYAFDAARFFKLLQDFQGEPDAQQFQDEHSLSLQRAFDIVCAVAGANEESMRQVAQLGILSDARLQRCPAEYAQTSKAWKTLLTPHLRRPPAAS